MISLVSKDCDTYIITVYLKFDSIFRHKANVNLGMVVAPFTEFSYIHQFGGETTGEKVDAIEEREKRFKCAEQAFLSTMR